ncbi:hypothetical protein [Amycolatopsis sp. NPDC006125]|uniref:hypothetical protein n=1 Tax=Amycolatopsis sp. NPDC006125 TaxID=3156730 RepID=UPI0033BDB35E
MTTLPHHEAGDWPDVGNDDVPCCMGSAQHGARGCTCWQPIYDLAQMPPRTGLEPGTRDGMCDGCAYRPRSPERTGAPDAAADLDDLERLAATGQPFWCHEGMRRPLEWRHPSGATVPGSPLDYQPPFIDGVPYRANGTPAARCGGWAAVRRKHQKRGEESSCSHAETTATNATPAATHAPCAGPAPAGPRTPTATTNPAAGAPAPGEHEVTR